MIRVLNIVGAMNRGGLETTLINIFRSIDKRKIIFDFMVLDNRKAAYDDEIKSLGGKIYCIPSRKKGITKNKKALEIFFSKHKEYKIIHQHVSSLSYIEPIKIAFKFGFPTRIIHSRNTQQGGLFLHKYLHKYNQRKINIFATDFFACSDLAAKWLYGNKRYNDKKYKIIKNGINTDKFQFNENIRIKIRKQLDVKDEIVIGNVARFHPQKNHMFLLDIFKYILKKLPSSKLILVGDGQLQDSIRSKIKKFKLTNNVILIGNIPNVNDLLQAFDIFILPSLYEGLPGSVIEAQGAGLPCLVSDVITKQVKITNLVHFYPLTRSPQEWADKILNLIDTCKKRTNTKKEVIAAGYDIKKIATDLQDFYIKKINKPNKKYYL